MSDLCVCALLSLDSKTRACFLGETESFPESDILELPLTEDGLCRVEAVRVLKSRHRKPTQVLSKHERAQEVYRWAKAEVKHTMLLLFDVSDNEH